MSVSDTSEADGNSADAVIWDDNDGDVTDSIMLCDITCEHRIMSGNIDIHSFPLFLPNVSFPINVLFSMTLSQCLNG